MPLILFARQGKFPCARTKVWAFLAGACGQQLFLSKQPLNSCDENVPANRDFLKRFGVTETHGGPTSDYT